MQPKIVQLSSSSIVFTTTDGLGQQKVNIMVKMYGLDELGRLWQLDTDKWVKINDGLPSATKELLKQN